jgi:hypothetical protein
VAKRARARKSAASPAGVAPAVARPGARRLAITLGVTFGLGALAALVVPATGATLLWLLVVLAAALAGVRAGRACGLPAGVAATLAAGVTFALILACGAACGPELPPGLALPALAVTALGALLVVDIVAVTPGVPAARGERLLAALRRGPLLRVVTTVALGGLAVRGVMVALSTEHNPAFAVSLLAIVAAVELWRQPSPGGTLLAALLLGLQPAVLALGVGTNFGLWSPVTRTLAVVVSGDPPRRLLLVAASVIAAALGGALALLGAAPERGAAA